MLKKTMACAALVAALVLPWLASGTTARAPTVPDAAKDNAQAPKATERDTDTDRVPDAVIVITGKRPV
jgi:hypothetical protein